MNEPISQNFPKLPNGEMQLSDKQWMAIELLIAGHNLCEKAAAVGVDRRTLYNWRNDDGFRKASRQRRQEIWSHSAERLKVLVNPALNILHRQMSDRNDRARFRAATASVAEVLPFLRGLGDDGDRLGGCGAIVLTHA